MKILLAFHSRSGSTERLADKIKKNFEKKGYEVDVEKVEPQKERGFWTWQLLRIFYSEVDIKAPNIKDASRYDAIIFGSPNWTRVSLPMKRYISGMTGLRGKSVALFSTTTLWPSFEWYFFSAYFLFSTFSRAVIKKGGRVVDSILLSSFIKKEGIDSKRGEKTINDFCRKIAAREGRFKTSIIQRREIEDIRFLTVFFSSLAIISLLIQTLSSSFGYEPLNWSSYSVILTILVSVTAMMAHTIESRWNPFFVKFMASVSLAFLWTLLLSFIQGEVHGIVQAGYISIFVFMGLFKNMAAVMSAGAASFIGYAYLFFSRSDVSAFSPLADSASLLFVLGVVLFVTQNIQNYFISLTEVQEEAETARMILEVKVKARTKELKEFNKNLEEMVKKRTEDLKTKVEELEQFSKLTVGREMRMIELKEKIEELEGKKREKKNGSD